MRGLTILVASAEGARIRSALTLASASAALGASVRLFLDAEAVPLLALESGYDEAHRRAGLPTLAELFEEAFAAGVRVLACQTGLALSGSSAERFDPRIEWSGMIGVLARLENDRLVAI